MDERKIALKVTKGGFVAFTDHFMLTSGGRTMFDVTLWPLPTKRVEKERPKPVPSESEPEMGTVEPVPEPDLNVWKDILPAEAPANPFGTVKCEPAFCLNA